MKTKSEILDEMAKQNQKLGLYEPPYISDDFQIGPDGAYEHTEPEEADTSTTWDTIYESYKGVSDLLDFLDWLKENYRAPNKI